MKWRDGGRRVSGRRRRSRAEGDGLTSASGPRAHRGPSRGRAARRETPARSTDSTTRLLFLARKWRIAARGGGGGTESDERRARARTRRGGRRACSMRRGGRARTLEAGDASGVVARTGTRSRTRSSEEANKQREKQKHLRSLKRFRRSIRVCVISLYILPVIEQKSPLGGSWQSRLQDPDASGLGAPRVTSGAARQGDTGVPRRGTAHAKRFAWPPPARARRETHSGSSRLVDG